MAEVSEVYCDRGVAEMSAVADVSEVCHDRFVSEESKVCCDRGCGRPVRGVL